MSHLLSPLPFQPILDKEYADILQVQFNKRFTFPSGRPDPPSGPLYTSDYWVDDSLQGMKDRLNTCKSKLNNLPLHKWHKHTKKLNPAGTIPQELRKVAQPELLTQAWEKFHECFHTFNLGPRSRDFNSVHLCEAPGAFITSLNHALVSSHPETNWNWIGTTLNPHYEGNSLGFMINDDRFILGCLDNWEFGVDNTGDLMNINNLNKLKERCKGMGDIHLVTADGSIDCQGEPARQESIVSRLLESEIYTALSILSEGGNFVIKMFTMFESETVCMMYLLDLCFNKIEVFKPATSKEGNSEVYVVCLDFKRSDWVNKYLEETKGIFGKWPEDKNLFAKSDVPEDFIQEVKKSSDLFLQLQENVIENNLHYFDDPMNAGDLKDLAEIQLQVAEHFIKIYKIEEIPNYRKVVYNRTDPNISQLDSRSEQGSYLDRVAESSLDTEKKLENIRKALKIWKVKGRLRFVEWVPAPALAICLDTPVRGAKLTRIASSKFCTGRHLQYYNQTIDLLGELRDSDDEDEPKKKKKKTDKVFSGETRPLVDCVDASRILFKISKIFPDMVEKTKVLSFTIPVSDSTNVLSLECESKNQLKLIATLITAIMNLDTGDHIILEGLPLFTRITVATFFSVASLFEDVGFVRPNLNNHLIILSKFLVRKDSSATEKSLASLERIITEVMSCGEDEQVLSVWSVKDLVQDPIYSEMVLFNQLTIKEQIIRLTQFMEPPPPPPPDQSEGQPS